MTRALLVLLLLPVLPIAGADTSGCTVYTQEPFLAAGSYYLWTPSTIPLGGIPFELWQETNGIPGLQRVSSPCEAGPSLPRDACLTHINTNQIPACVLTYPGP